MSPVLQNILGILLLIGVFILTRYGIGWKLKGAVKHILADLKARNAVDVYSAVHLEYAKKPWLRLGLRDYRPKALQSLLAAGVVGRTGEEKYYLIVDLSQGKGVGEDPTRV